MTLATIEAAAIERHVASPPTIGRASQHLLRHHVAVDERRIDGRGEAGDRAPHRLQRRLQDVDAVDRGYRAEGDGDLRTLAELGEEFLAPLRSRTFELAIPFGSRFGSSTTARRQPARRAARGLLRRRRRCARTLAEKLCSPGSWRGRPEPSALRIPQVPCPPISRRGIPGKATGRKSQTIPRRCRALSLRAAARRAPASIARRPVPAARRCRRGACGARC